MENQVALKLFRWKQKNIQKWQLKIITKSCAWKHAASKDEKESNQYQEIWVSSSCRQLAIFKFKRIRSFAFPDNLSIFLCKCYSMNPVQGKWTYCSSSFTSLPHHTTYQQPTIEWEKYIFGIVSVLSILLPDFSYVQLPPTRNYLWKG